MSRAGPSPLKLPETTVRASLLGAPLRALARISPRLVSSLLGRLLMTPPRRVAAELDSRLREGAHRFSVTSNGRAVSAWSWGAGPTVLLVHGWGGRGAQLTPFVEPLLAAGLRVVSFDAPGHGASGGSLSSVVDIAHSIRAVESAVGCVSGVIAHSAGSAATTLALHAGLGATRVVYVAPTLRPGAFLRGILSLLRLPEGVVHATEVRMERRVGATFRDVHKSIATPAPGVRLLVVHDRSDPVVPYRDGRELSELWRGAELLTTRGLGHALVLRDVDVIARTVAFLANVSDAQASAHATIGSAVLA